MFGALKLQIRFLGMNIRNGFVVFQALVQPLRAKRKKEKGIENSVEIQEVYGGSDGN